MGYEAEIKDLESQPTAVTRWNIKRANLGQTFGKALPEVFNYLNEEGLTPGGPPFGRYFKFTDDEVDVEIGIPVSKQIGGNDRIEPSALPAGKVAVTTHVGPYDNLPAAYDFLYSWIESNDAYHPGDAPWESYVSDPGDMSDPSKMVTEVFWPLITMGEAN